MIRRQRFIAFIGISGATVLIASYILMLLGIADMGMKFRNKMSENAEYWINFALFMGNMYFVFSVVLRGLCANIAKPMAAFGILVLVTSPIIGGTLLQTAGAPFIFLAAYGFAGSAVSRDRKQRFNPLRIICIRFAAVSATIVAYQLAIGLIRAKGSILYMVNARTTIDLSIDLFLLYLFYRKVVQEYAGHGRKFLVFPKEESIPKSDGVREKPVGYDDLTKRQRTIFCILSQGYQLFQLLVVLAIGLLNSMIAELSVMLVMFWVGRGILGSSWHSEKLWVCSCVTFLGFYALTKMALPFSVSLFSAIALSAAFVWLLHVLGVKEEQLEHLKERYNEDFTRYGLSVEMANFAHDWKVKGLSDKELMQAHDIRSKSTLNSRKRFVRDKIAAHDQEKHHINT